MTDSDKKMSSEEMLIKNFLSRCKNQGASADFWPRPSSSGSSVASSGSSSEMVGYYSEATLPMGPAVQTSEESSPLSVKRVVCSPDLPITAQYSSEARQPTASAQENIRCQLCDKMFTSKSALQAHQRTHSKESEDPYRCNICSKTFAVPARLTRHYRTHTGEKPFRCEFCNKSFSVKENLSVHRRIHTKERPYKCEVCSRAFEHSGKLHRHMRIHTGERPHKCTVCSKTFIQSGQLVIHMRTHTGEKPYVCSVCQKGFTCSKQLKVHLRTHTGEKPYSCEICGKSFGYNHVLKLHQVAHFGEKVYKCTICNDTFNSKKCMEAHIKSHSENAQAAASAAASPSVVAPSDSSCSSSSDKENKDTPVDLVVGIPESTTVVSYDSDIRYYLYAKERAGSVSPHNTFAAYVPESPFYPPSGVDLLAAAASATERDPLRTSPDIVLNLITKAAATAPSDMVAATLRHPAYFTSPSSLHSYDATPLNAGDNIRKQVEACLAVEEIASEDDVAFTPPSSNPVSPASSVSPDPELSLPPRKRSKMILKSMETTSIIKEESPVRYSSVIQYARAS